MSTASVVLLINFQGNNVLAFFIWSASRRDFRWPFDPVVLQWSDFGPLFCFCDGIRRLGFKVMFVLNSAANPKHYTPSPTPHFPTLQDRSHKISAGGRKNSVMWSGVFEISLNMTSCTEHQLPRKARSVLLNLCSMQRRVTSSWHGDFTVNIRSVLANLPPINHVWTYYYLRIRLCFNLQIRQIKVIAVLDHRVTWRRSHDDVTDIASFCQRPAALRLTRPVVILARNAVNRNNKWPAVCNSAFRLYSDCLMIVLFRCPWRFVIATRTWELNQN